MNLNPGEIYRKTLGKPELRSAYIEELYEIRDQAERSGRLKGGYKKLIDACLSVLGEGDSLAVDFGNEPKS